MDDGPTRVSGPDPADQGAVIAFLRDAASHPGATSVDVIETHGNLVFLAGEYAWKIKRAVKFPYLDFSTVALRHRACLHEMEVNARLAPDLYLGVVPITRDEHGGLAIGGAGSPVEWAVQMRRFEQSDLLSAKAKAGPLPTELAKAVADTVYASHADASRVDGNGAARVERVLTPLFASLHVSKALGAQSVTELSAAVQGHFRACAELLDRRSTAGRVRRCHGDLHCANIVLWQGKPMLYDAIEFDDELASVDTLYDLAFLLMDLERRGQREAANLVLNRYLWRSNDALDIEGLGVLPLFLCMRASVRALVTAERAEQKVPSEAERDRHAAREFVLKARGYLEPVAPRVVAVGGLSGTGKSTLAARLAPLLGNGPGALHLRSDLERKSLFGVGETERLPASAYTQDAARRVYEVLRDKARLALAAGWSVVVDAVSAKPHERQMFAGLARDQGAEFRGLWLTAPADVLLPRVAARRNDASDADEAVLRAQLAWDIGPLTDGWQALDASGTLSATLQDARRVLALGDRGVAIMDQRP